MITVRDVLGVDSGELQELNKQLDRVIANCGKLRALGIKIKGKNLRELDVLIKKEL